MTKTIIILAIATTFVAGMLVSAPEIYAPPPPNNPGQPFDAILQKLDQIITTISGTDTEVANIEEKLDGTVASKITDIDTEVGNIEAKLDSGTTGLGAIKGVIDTIDTEVGNIEAKLDNPNFGLEEIKDEVTTIESFQYVPFKAINTDDEVCDAPDAGSTPSIKSILVQSSGTDGTILVTGAVVVMKNLDASDTVVGRNYLFDQNGISPSDTIDLTGTATGDEGFELLGQPTITGVNSPHQMAGDEGGNLEVVFTLSCNAGTSGSDITIEEVFISGWKPSDSVISVSYS